MLILPGESRIMSGEVEGVECTQVGEEVSGGNNCNPKSGFLCLESEGSPVEFKGLRIRELP